MIGEAAPALEGVAGVASAGRLDTFLRRLAAVLVLVAIGELWAIVAFGRAGDPRFTLDLNAAAVDFIAIIIGFPIAGALIARRQPRLLVAWLMLVIGVVSGLDLALFGYGTTGLPPGPERPGAVVAVWLAEWLWVPVVAAAITLFSLRFPDGRLIDRRWRVVELLAAVSGIAYVLATALGPGELDSENLPGIANPFGAPAHVAGLFDFLATAGNSGLVLAILAGATSMVLRYRAADRVQRAQIRWIAVVAVLVAPTIAIGALQIEGLSDAGFAIGLGALATLPAAVLVAITRYRLYDIDRIINRAVLYGSLTAILAGVFTASIGLSQRVFVAATGEKSDAAIVLTTLVVASAYTPVRRRLETLVDRLYKYESRRFGPYREALNAVLEVMDRDLAAGRLVREAVDGLGSAGGAVVDREERPIATSGSWPAPVSVRVPIGESGQIVGSLLLGPRIDGEAHDPRAIAELAEVAGLAARAMTPPAPPDEDGVATSPGRISPSG